MPWYVLTSGQQASNSTNYTLVGSQPTCPGTDQICAIQANDDGAGFPDITTGLRDNMIDALNTRTDFPNVLLKV